VDEALCLLKPLVGPLLMFYPKNAALWLQLCFKKPLLNFSKLFSDQ